MASRKQAVLDYFDGFRRSDEAAIRALLAEDVIWDQPGYRSFVGLPGSDGEPERERFEGNPTLIVDRLVEEGDAVVAIGSGEIPFVTGDVHRFVFCDVFTFTDDRIRRVESYLVSTDD